MRVAMINLKGGTAKTTSSIFLAAAFARRGRTLLADCDPQASALSWAESAEERGQDLGFSVVGLPVRDVHKKMKKLQSDYEHVVLDTPPGDKGITRSALLAAEAALVALSPAAMDVDRLRPTLELLMEVEPMNDLAYGVLLTRVRRITRESRDARTVLGEIGLPVLSTEVPLLSYYSDAFGQTVSSARDYETVAAELLGETVREPALNGGAA